MPDTRSDTRPSLSFLPLPERIKAFRDPEARRKLRYEAVEEKKSWRFSRRWDLVYMITAPEQASRKEERRRDRQDPRAGCHRCLSRSLAGRGLGHRVPDLLHHGDEQAVAEINHSLLPSSASRTSARGVR